MNGHGGFAKCLAFIGLLAFAAPGVAQTFNVGQDFATATLFTDSSSIPPDTNGTVGPNNVVTTINGRFKVQDKTGALQVSKSLTTFWADAGVTSPDIFDPRVMYDSSTGRFFAVSVANRVSASSQILVAVSNTSNPAGAWTARAIDADPADLRWADFPTFGVNSTGIYIAANMFGISGASTTVSLIALAKAGFISNPATAEIERFNSIDPNGTGFAVQPAWDFSQGGNPMQLLSKFNGDNLKRSTFTGTFDGVSNNNSIVLNTAGGFISVTAQSNPIDGRQPGPNDNVDSGDTRLSGNVVLKNGILWAVNSFDPAGADNSALQWFKIDVATSSILQTGTITLAGSDLYYGSIAVNESGDVVIGMSGSSNTQAISTFAVVGTTSGGTTTFGAPTIVFNSGSTLEYLQAPGGANRWGDYSATVVDPTDPGIFWIMQEHVSATNTWRTRAAEVIPTKANEVRWRSAASSTFNTGANWFNNLVPGAADHAIFSRSGAAYTVTMPAGTTNNNRMSLRQGTMTLSIPGGSTYSLTNAVITTPSLMVAEFQGTANLTVSGGGTLQSVNASLGAGLGGSPTFTAGNATMTVTGAGTTWNNTNNLFIGGSNSAAGGTGTLNVTASGAVNVSGTTTIWNTLSGIAVDNASYSTGALSSPGGTTPTINLQTAGATLTIANGLGQTFTGNIIGSGSVVKNGAGTQILSGANSYTGSTTINAGILQSNGSLSTGGVTGSAPVNLGNAGSSLTISNGLGLTFGGAITGTGSFTKSGTGTQTLAGVNTYTGATSINGGILRVNGSVTGAGGAFTINNTGTLSGTGNIARTVTINSGGAVQPGSSPGNLTTAGETWFAGGNYNWQIRDAAGTAGNINGFSLLTINGTLDLTNLTAVNRFNVNLWSLSAVSPDINGNAANFNNALPSTYLIAAATTITGFNASFFNIFTAANGGTAGFSNPLGGGFFSLRTFGGNMFLNFSPVPEPSPLLLLAIPALAGLALRWRQRRGQRATG